LKKKVPEIKPLGCDHINAFLESWVKDGSCKTCQFRIEGDESFIAYFKRHPNLPFVSPTSYCIMQEHPESYPEDERDILEYYFGHDSDNHVCWFTDESLETKAFPDKCDVGRWTERGDDGMRYLMPNCMAYQPRTITDKALIKQQSEQQDRFLNTLIEALGHREDCKKMRKEIIKLRETAKTEEKELNDSPVWKAINQGMTDRKKQGK
jgi:hypothetical protein